MPNETSEIRSCPDQNGRLAITRLQRAQWLQSCTPSQVRCRSNTASCPEGHQPIAGDGPDRRRQRAHPSIYDSQAQIRRVSVVFAKEECEYRETPQPGHICNSGEGETARARDPVLQAALTSRQRTPPTRSDSKPGQCAWHPNRKWRVAGVFFATRSAVISRGVKP